MAEGAHTLQWAPLSTRIAPSHAGIWTRYLTHIFLGPKRAQNPYGTLIGSAVFAQMAAECPYTLQWFARFPFP